MNFKLQYNHSLDIFECIIFLGLVAILVNLI